MNFISSFSFLTHYKLLKFCKNGVLRNFAKFTEFKIHLCQGLFLNRNAGRPVTLLKKRLWHRCFPVNFAKFLRHLFYRTPLGDYFCNVPYKKFLLLKIYLINRFLQRRVSNKRRPLITAAHLGIHIEVSAFRLINTAPIRIVTIFY